MRKILLYALTLAATTAWGHGHDDDGTGELNVEHFAEMMALAPDVMVSDSHTTAYMDIGKTRYYMNGPFWRMTQGWIRQYYRELSKECVIDWSEEKFTQVATDAAAKSFVGEKILNPAIEGIEHIAVGTADIAAEEGAVAGGIKLAAEVAETGASKAVGGAGVHVACHLIDAMILFGTRHIQTAGRAYFWSKQMDRSSLLTMLKMAFVARAAGRVQNRVQFVAGPVEVDEEAMRAVDLEGPSRWMSRKKNGSPRWWGRLFRIQDGKRAKWVQDLAQSNGKPMKLAGKSFMGSQAYYAAFLKGRKLGYPTFMKGKTSMDKTLGRTMLWVLSAQTIAQRSFKDEGQPIDTTLALADQRTPVNDDIRRGLAEEVSNSSEQADVIESLLREVDVIYQPDIPSTVRYAHAQVLEAYIYGFMYGRYKSALEEKSEIYPGAADSYWEKFTAIGSMIAFRWRAGFGQHIQKWGDFLKLAALQNDPKRLAKHRYEMQEGLLRIFRTMQAGATVASADSPQDLAAFKEVMRSEYKQLKTFTPWKEKREGFFWIPVKPALDWIPLQRRMPACLDLAKAGA